MSKHLLGEVVVTVLVIDTFSVYDEDAQRWGHTFLSNGYIEPDGSFVEREYQAAKTLDPDEYAHVITATLPFGPDGSKQRGRAVSLRPDWERVKVPIMTKLVYRKFADHPELAAELFATDNAMLIEGNTWHDNFWGTCRCWTGRCRDEGHNTLGVILMSVREALRA